MLEASMKDIKPHIDAMTKEKANLKGAMDADVEEAQLKMIVDHINRIINGFDEQVKTAKRSLPKAPKPKGKAKAKSAAQS